MCVRKTMLVALSEKELHSCIKYTLCNLEELVSVPNLSEGFGVAKLSYNSKDTRVVRFKCHQQCQVMNPDIGVVNGDVFYRKEYFLKSNLGVYYTKKFQTVLMFC